MQNYNLSDEQKSVIDTFVNTDINTVVIGKAGVGKSVTLRELIKNSDETNQHGFVLAPTGVAAINVGGMTIHKFMGRINNIKEYPRRKIDFIIIDEISMVRADLLDDLSKTLQRYNGDHRAFGGCRIVCIGDPAQLPPVLREDSDEWDYVYDNYHTPSLVS